MQCRCVHVWVLLRSLLAVRVVSFDYVLIWSCCLLVSCMQQAVLLLFPYAFSLARCLVFLSLARGRAPTTVPMLDSFIARSIASGSDNCNDYTSMLSPVLLAH